MTTTRLYEPVTVGEVLDALERRHDVPHHLNQIALESTLGEERAANRGEVVTGDEVRIIIILLSDVLIPLHQLAVERERS